MHHTQIAAELKEIIATYLADPVHIQAGSSEELKNKKKQVLTSLLDRLRVRMCHTEFPAKNIAYLLIYITDSPDFSNLQDITESYRKSLRILPAVMDHVTKSRQLSFRLYKFIRDCGNQLHCDLINNSMVRILNEWKDPITGFVMNFPVSYTIGSTTYTIDLVSLSMHSAGKYSLVCPFTKQILLLSDLNPCIKMRQHIIADCRAVQHNNEKSDDINLELAEGLQLIKVGNLPDFKFWLSNRSNDKYLTHPIQDAGFTGSLFFHSCRLKQYTIAILFLETGLSLNLPEGERFFYHNLKDLEDCTRATPSNIGLKCLLALSYNEAMLQSIDQKNTKNAKLFGNKLNVAFKFLLENDYLPAKVIFSGLLFKQNSLPAIKEAIKLLLDAIDKGYPAAFMIMLEKFSELDPVVIDILTDDTIEPPVLSSEILDEYNFKVLRHDGINIFRVMNAQMCVKEFVESYDSQNRNIGYTWLVALCYDSYARTDPEHNIPTLNRLCGAENLCQRYTAQQASLKLLAPIIEESLNTSFPRLSAAKLC